MSESHAPKPAVQVNPPAIPEKAHLSPTRRSHACCLFDDVADAAQVRRLPQKARDVTDTPERSSHTTPGGTYMVDGDTQTQRVLDRNGKIVLTVSEIVHHRAYDAVRLEGPALAEAWDSNMLDLHCRDAGGAAAIVRGRSLVGEHGIPDRLRAEGISSVLADAIDAAMDARTERLQAAARRQARWRGIAGN